MIVIERILCPVDFSPFSERALRYAAALAGWYEASLTVLSVQPRPLLTTRSRSGSGSRSDVGEHSEHATAFVSGVLGATATPVVTTAGSVVPEILRVGVELPADLIVMGTHGVSGFQRLLLGSVAEKVLRKAPCPVLTVPRLVTQEAAQAVNLETILCAVDFSRASTRAVDYALAFAQESGGHVVLFHALEWFAEEQEKLPPHVNTREFPTSEQDARMQLEELVPKEARSWCDPEMVVGYGQPYREVLRVAKERPVDLVVLGVQGRGAVDLTLFGSTTQHVVREATCPVLTVGPLSGTSAGGAIERSIEMASDGDQYLL